MDEFEKLRAELEAFSNISALARESGLSRRQLQRIRNRKVESTTLRTLAKIRRAMRALEDRQEAAA